MKLIIGIIALVMLKRTIQDWYNSLSQSQKDQFNTIKRWLAIALLLLILAWIGAKSLLLALLLL